jgi:hypothetical protein
VNHFFEALDRIMDNSDRAKLERERQRVRLDAFAKADAELYLERVSDDMALVRLNIGHMSFGIGQPRNGTEANSVMRTFRDALTDLLMAAKESGCECAEIDAADRKFPKE